MRNQWTAKRLVQSERFRLLHVERVSTGHLQIDVRSLCSNHVLTYRLINDFSDLNTLRVREWIRLHEEPFMGDLVHQMRPPIYAVEGLIVEHLDD